MDAPFAPVHAFCSFAEDDAPLLEQLERYLKPLQRAGYLSLWHKHQTIAGSDRQEGVDRHLNNASLIFLLVSDYYLDSDACDSEMRRALERHEANKAVVVPILLRPCDWQDAPFATLQTLPTGNRPIMTWSNHGKAWANVVIGIRHLLNEEFGVKGKVTQGIYKIDKPFVGQSGSRSTISTGLQQVQIQHVPFAPNRVSKKGLIILLIIALLLVAILGGKYLFFNGWPTTTTAMASGPVYTVIHTDDTKPDGVYFRYSPHTQDFDKVTGFGVFWNDLIRVSCWSWGDTASQNGNKVWYYAHNITRPTVEVDGRSNQGWINSYYVNDGMTANHVAPGISQCGSSVSDHLNLAAINS